MQWPLEAHGINIVSEISPYGQTINRHRINLFVIVIMTQWIVKIYVHYFYSVLLTKNTIQLYSYVTKSVNFMS